MNEVEVYSKQYSIYASFSLLAAFSIPHFDVLVSLSLPDGFAGWSRILLQPLR